MLNKREQLLIRKTKGYVNISNELYVYPLTGNADSPGQYYLDDVGLGGGATLSSAFYDRPWNYSSPREVNFFMRIDFR